MAAEIDSADPHHYATGPNYTFRDNLYQGLTKIDAKGRAMPALAQSWSRSDDLTWRFKLASGVRFSDGSPFGTRDVIATFCRILNNKEELVSSYSRIVRRFAEVAEDAGDLVIRTVAPEPLLATDLASLAIIPLHFESGLWAMRTGIRYAGRQDQTTLAAEVSSAR